ncbi:MAG: ChaN family lipoprotein [Bacteroidetes bacterium]|nr:ChaN family lipoprotein [Bacteroidota bacterium]
MKEKSMSPINNKSTVLNTFWALVMLPLLMISSPSFGQLNESNYKIYSVKLNKEVSLTDIAEEMITADVLLFGEEHNDSVAHHLQIKMLETLYLKFNNNIAISMEMFDRDVQIVMDEYLQGNIREKNFIKDARVWKNYRDYKPMVEFAKEKKLTVICANAPSRYTNLAGRKGPSALKELSAESKKNFAPLPYDTASGKYYEKLMALTSHDAPVANDTSALKMPPMPAMGNFNMIPAQSLWDATMAYSIASYLKQNKGRKVLQLNGRFHSDEGFAIVTQLKKYNAKIKSLIISAGSDESYPDIDWNKHKHLGDYIFITDPNVPKTYPE